MKRTLIRCLTSQPYFTMGSLAAASVATGALLINPGTDTFAASTNWTVLSRLTIGPFHPSENSWGAIIFTMGLLMAVSLFLLDKALRDGAQGTALQEAIFSFSRVVWGFSAVLWTGFAASVVLSNPASLTSLWFFFLGALPSLWIVGRVKIVIGAGEGESGR